MAQSQLCSKCQHNNPSEAIYCFYDGALLQGHSANGGPINPGTAPFSAPFVFPSGQTCQNFDQLAMACQRNWDIARDLLNQGFLHGFFGGLGRADLAKAAQEAAKFPDHDRGLDQLLSKLPSNVLEEPKLKVEPSSVNLGMVHMGTNRQFDLNLDNQGMRLIYGSVASDSKWLMLGDSPPQKQKIFQFGGDDTIKVNIVGEKLRAGPKPLVGQLFIESNGGKPITVKVKLEVPIKPFAEGALSGARTPREVAIKAREAPKEAAVLFENGSVERWFKDNGWIYPVQGPAGAGLGAVQQFFEALGLAKAPKVTLDQQSVALTGQVGQPLQTVLKVETPEKRPVYAHATADEAWLDVSQTKVEAKGRIVLICVNVPGVPARPGQTLTATIRVAANGNQRFKVPVALNVLGTPGVVYAQPTMEMPAPPILAIPDDHGMTVPVDSGQQGIMAMPAPTFGNEVVPASPGQTFSFQPEAAPAMAPDIAPANGGIMAQPVSGYQQPGGRRKETPVWMLQLLVHGLPLVLLGMALLITLIRDLLAPAIAIGPQDEIPLDRRPLISIGFNYPDKANAPGLNRTLGADMSFGVRTIPPKGEAVGNFKKLTFNRHGQTNSTVIKFDARTIEFGSKFQGKWAEEPKEIGKWGTSKLARWQGLIAPIEVVQKVERIPGEPFVENGRYKRALDTCLVRYELKNMDNIAHQVGLRIVLDTFIGGNDGVPFSVPGIGLVNSKRALPMDLPPGTPLPDFLQVLERSDLKNPGTLVQLNLKIGDGWEAPGKIYLTRWPGWKRDPRTGLEDIDKLSLHKWIAPIRSFQGTGRTPPDSAVVLYWEPVRLKKKEVRKIGFSYGLGQISSETGVIGLSASPNKKVGDVVTILARVGDPKVGSVTLNLKSGLSLLDPATRTQTVPPLPAGVVGRPREVTWRASATEVGNHMIEARTDTKISQETVINIKRKGGTIFGS